MDSQDATGSAGARITCDIVVGCPLVVALCFLDGRRRLQGMYVRSLVVYDAE